jgi:hypothetical protein
VNPTCVDDSNIVRNQVTEIRDKTKIVVGQKEKVSLTFVLCPSKSTNDTLYDSSPPSSERKGSSSRPQQISTQAEPDNDNSRHSSSGNKDSPARPKQTSLHIGPGAGPSAGPSAWSGAGPSAGSGAGSSAGPRAGSGISCKQDEDLEVSPARTADDAVKVRKKRTPAEVRI